MLRISVLGIVMLFSLTSFAIRDERAGSKVFNLFQINRPVNQSTPGSGSNEESCKVGKAANLALASLYGSCQAPQTAKGPASGGGKDSCGSELPQSGEIKSTFKSGCGSGGMPEYSQAGARMQLKGDIVSFPNKKTDCSGIASGIQCRAGNNLKPGQDDCKPSTTAEMINWGKGGDCYERVTDGKLKAGDMIVTRKGGGKGGSGHVVTIADDKGGGSGNPEDYMVVEASSKSTGIVKRSPAAGGQATARAFKSALAGGDGGGSWTVLRHKGDKTAGCKSNKKRTFEGEQCVQSCPNISPETKI